MYNNSAKLQLVFKYTLGTTSRCDLIVAVDHTINFFLVAVPIGDRMLSNPGKVTIYRYPSNF